MIFVKINETMYPATIEGRLCDAAWDNRESKSITIEMDYESANAMFVDGMVWSIVQRDEEPVYLVDENDEFVLDDNGEFVQIDTVANEEEFDNSEFNICFGLDFKS